MSATPILHDLRNNDQQLDRQIAAATGIPLPKVRTSLTDLAARGEISRCNVIRFNDGKAIEGTLCRISGTFPPKAPGRKPSTGRLGRRHRRPVDPSQAPRASPAHRGA